MDRELYFTPEQLCALNHPQGCQCESLAALRHRLAKAEGLLEKVASHLESTHVLYDVHVLGYRVREYVGKLKR